MRRSEGENPSANIIRNKPCGGNAAESFVNKTPLVEPRMAAHASLKSKEAITKRGKGIQREKKE